MLQVRHYSSTNIIYKKISEFLYSDSSDATAVELSDIQTAAATGHRRPAWSFIIKFSTTSTGI
jgi:hypothetical protein